MEKMNPECKVVILAEKTPHGEHERRFNTPTAAEVAIIIVREQHGMRDIVLEEKSESLKRIPDMHMSYDELQYPLMF